MSILSIPVGNYIQLALNLGNKVKAQHRRIFERPFAGITNNAFHTRHPVRYHLSKISSRVLF